MIDVAQLVECLNRTRHRRLLDTEAVSDFGDPYLVGLPFQLQDGLEIVLLRGGEVARVLGTSGCFLRHGRLSYEDPSLRNTTYLRVITFG